ncbi:hypothetical protein [Rhodoferax sediminis]|uniref:hypothetical protein n=1 Tax=Rhodoferax sediminis TaxID=2509614 RepID=UPI00115EE976|nr:hypothetical protein [Rhodoferax sediminis]
MSNLFDTSESLPDLGERLRHCLARGVSAALPEACSLYTSTTATCPATTGTQEAASPCLIETS